MAGCGCRAQISGLVGAAGGRAWDCLSRNGIGDGDRYVLRVPERNEWESRLLETRVWY